MGMILGIGHESGVGKDTFSMFLTDYLRSRKIKGLNIIREGFADRLYDIAYLMYSWSGFKTRQHYAINPGDKLIVLPLLGKAPKQLLIELSNALCGYDNSMFLNAVSKDTTPFHLKIVPDVRRPWEFKALSENNNAYLLKITKPGPESTWEMDRDLKGAAWYETVVNDGDLLSFMEKAKEFAERIILPRLYNHLNRTCP